MAKVCNGHVDIPKDFLDMCREQIRLNDSATQQYYYFFDSSTRSLMIAIDSIESPKLPNLCLGVCNLNLDNRKLFFPENVKAALGDCKEIFFLTNPLRNRIYIRKCP